MHRFYVPDAKAQGSRLFITGREAHHAFSVLRLRPGDTATVLDGCGGVFTCHIAEAAHKRLSLDIGQVANHVPPAASITLVQALPKGGIFEDIVQKATELGVARIIPLLTERVVAKLDSKEGLRKTEKWRQVAIEAIKQSGNPWLPRIDPPTAMNAVLNGSLNPDLALIGSLQSESKHAGECFARFACEHQGKPKSVCIWIGPEGDFTRTEVQQVLRAGGLPITLGPRVLRVETAAIYCLAIINYELTAPA